MGIDAAHRATGVAVLTVIPGTLRLAELHATATLETYKQEGTINELNGVKLVVEQLRTFKLFHAAMFSACEVAHSGQSFESSRNVGITWAIAIATDSHPYTSAQVRTMFHKPKGTHAKDAAKAWLLANNWQLIDKLNACDHHQIDAICVALKHYQAATLL